METQFNYPRTMENGTVITNFKELREHIRVTSGRRTLHGIPKTERALMNVANQMNRELSKGHLSEKHIKEHEGNKNAVITTASERINTNLKAYRDTTGINCSFEASVLSGEAKHSEKMRRAMARANQPQMKAGGGKLFSQMMRNTPFGKRVKNGKVTYKLIRPLRIVLEKLSPARYEQYKAQGKKNSAGKTPRYRKANNVAYRSRVTKTQVVHPSYD